MNEADAVAHPQHTGLNQPAATLSAFSGPVNGAERLHPALPSISSHVKPIQNRSLPVDSCQCVQHGSIFRKAAVKKPETKLLLSHPNGNPVSVRQPDLKAFSDGLKAAVKAAHGRRLAPHGVKICEDTLAVALCGTPDAARQLRGATVAVSGQLICFSKIDATPQSTFICKDVPLGSSGIDRSALLHSVLHLLGGPDALCVSLQRVPFNGPTDWSGSVMVSLQRAHHISGFEFVLKRRDGFGDEQLLSFRSLESTDATLCSLCGGFTHATDKCPQWTVHVLEEKGGRHPRLQDKALW